MKEFSYEVIKKLGVLKRAKTMSLQANIISFNGGKPKLDIRWWHNPEEGNPAMGKGIALAKEEYEELREILEALHEKDS